MLTAPFPYVGSKKRASGLIWNALGDLSMYVEPFGGSLAVLLAAPKPAVSEVVNDANTFIPNFWRALRADPDGLLALCADPVTEADYKARHQWLVTEGAARLEELGLDKDPFIHDPLVAAWWAWGQSVSIGRWCLPGSDRGDGSFMGNVGQRPNLDPWNGFGDTDTWRQMFHALADRLKNVRVLCGGWERAVTSGVLFRHQRTKGRPVGVFLDPPYRAELRGEARLYGARSESVVQMVSNDEVEEWCRENGADERLRIALAGLEGEYELPGWRVESWRAPSASEGNRNGERLWLSPNCVGQVQGDLFSTDF